VATIPGVGHSPTVAEDPRDPTERGPIAPDDARVLVAWLQQQLGHAR
jgi:hypothetical protein